MMVSQCDGNSAFYYLIFQPITTELCNLQCKTALFSSWFDHLGFFCWTIIRKLEFLSQKLSVRLAYESTSVCEEEFLGSYLQIDHYSKKTKIAHLGWLSRSYASFSFHSVAFQCREYVIGITVAKSWPLVAPLFLEAPPRSSIVWGFPNLKKCRG